MPMMIMKVVAIAVFSHPVAAMIGLTKTDHAYTVPSSVMITTPAPAIAHRFDIRFSLLIVTPPKKKFYTSILHPAENEKNKITMFDVFNFLASN